MFNGQKWIDWNYIEDGVNGLVKQCCFNKSFLRQIPYTTNEINDDYDGDYYYFCYDGDDDDKKGDK